MLQFELKKVFSKFKNRMAIVLLLVIRVAVSMLTMNRVEYVDSDGNHVSGLIGARSLRAEKNKWKGEVTEDVLEGTPTMCQYKIHADAKSLYNTPPAYGIYICGKVFKWLKAKGGLAAMKEYNEKKAKILYDFLDESKLLKGTVVKEDRSLMNVPFVTGNEELDALFVKEAAAAGFVNLKGHRTVGGMRASIYNAMPIEGVEKLVEFMKKFEEAHQA